MAETITTSIRLPAPLRKRLELAAQTLRRGKNWIIVQALQEYFSKHPDEKLIQEAERQSLLANRKEAADTTIWERHADTRGWHG